MGFIFGSALGGIILVGWPLYLHLNKREKPVVQVIPSLLLFGVRKNAVRLSLLEQLLLLLSRIMLIVCLAALLSQPYLTSNMRLPLPLVNSEEPPQPILGILLDDSITSLHGETTSRLEDSRHWLIQEIRKLPDSARVIIALTSFPYPGKALTREKAVSLLENIKSVPYPGDAAKALHNLAKKLQGKAAAMVIAGPLNDALWEKRQPGLMSPAVTDFLDMSECRSKWWIHSVTRASRGKSAAGWVCMLSGDSEALQNQRLLVKGSSGTRWYCPITPNDARRHRVNLLLPGSVKEDWYRVSAEEEDAHPWREYFFLGDGFTAETGEHLTVLLRPPTREGLVADKVLTAAILSIYPEGEVYHADLDTAIEDLPVAGIVICVGANMLPATTSEWIVTRFKAGADILCLPIASPEPIETRKGGVLPQWAKPVPVFPQAILPLRHGSGKPQLPSSLLKGLGQAKYTVIAEPGFANRGGETLLSTRGGRAFLLLNSSPSGAKLWAFAVPLGLEAGSIVYHPALPLLVEELLFAEHRLVEQKHTNVNVGDSVNLAEWFKLPTPGGKLTHPDGTCRYIDPQITHPVRIRPEMAGPHVLEQKEGKLFRTVNYPRVNREAVKRREEWEKQFPEFTARWLTKADRLEPSFRIFGAGADASPSFTYDLSPIVTCLVLAMLLSEAILLLVCWRKNA